MKKIPEKKNHKTVFSLLVRPILTILFLVILVYTVMTYVNVLSYLKTNAAAVFKEQVAGKGVSVSNEMINRWSNIQDGVEKVVADIEQTVQEQEAEISDIRTDAALNQKILDGLMNDIIGMLRASGSTEIFLVLNGNAVISGEKEDVKAGVYLRNNNPDFYSSDNQDLLFERGLPAISKDWQISLDSYWTAGFDFSNENDVNNFFFTKPFRAALASDNKDFENFAYWNYGYPINPLDHSILTYSVPLITSDGSVIGVMGIGISGEYYNNIINYRELGEGKNGAYFLARTTDGIHFEPVFFNGLAYNKNSFVENSLVIQRKAGEPAEYLYLEEEEESSICASVKYLQLYGNNTPFEEERWAVVGLIPEAQIFAAYNSAQVMLAVLALGGGIIGIFGVFWTSRRVTKSLRRLMEDLRKSDSHKPIHLQRLYVEEIDELINAIESLSARVAASSSKISTIIQMAESGIGVYEYLKEDKLVFCSRSLYEICGWEPVINTNEYIDSTLFLQRMETLEETFIPDEENLYELMMPDNSIKWLRLNKVEDDKSIIGVVTDVTAAVLEKQQIEYERDYDMLTNLYNLRAFDESLHHLFEKQQEKIRIGALIMWDLDNLKFVNDVYGHHMGDAYIIALADCLRKYQSSQVLSARRSGDEFYTFIFGFENKEEAEKVLKSIWEEVQQAEIALPDGQFCRVRVSAGVSWYPENATDFSLLFQYSDFAMYTVKHNHKGNIEYFDSATYHEDWYLAQGQGDFNTLLDNRLVRYAAQPIMAVRDGSIYGYEMLMRSDMDSFQTPADILRMARAQSRLYDIEVMTWFEALRAFAQLTEYGFLEKEKKVFINSVASQLLKRDMQEMLELKYGDYLPYVVCEFTEEEQGNSQITGDKLELMHRWKAQIAVDDYGCGYNSETILLAINPDIVKIDMEIVRGIDRDENRQQLVKNLVLYAKNRNIQVLGEGVETFEELQTLIELGVTLVQGYYIARPSFEGVPPTDKVRQEAAELWRQAQEK